MPNNPRYTFPAEKKIRNRSTFRSVFAEAIRFRTKNFTVLQRPNPTATTQSRLGVIVAKRNIHNAVLRNRAKRLIRESFRKHQHTLKGIDVILILRQNFSNKEALDDIKLCLEKLWLKLMKE